MAEPGELVTYREAMAANKHKFFILIARHGSLGTLLDSSTFSQPLLSYRLQSKLIIRRENMKYLFYLEQKALKLDPPHRTVRSPCNSAVPTNRTFPNRRKREAMKEEVQ